MLINLGICSQLTDTTQVTHFSFWSILKSPLILGNDVTNMSNETLSIITNSLVISFNQDVGSGPANRMWKRTLKEGGDLQLWAMSLANKSVHQQLCSPDRSFLTFPCVAVSSLLF